MLPPGGSRRTHARGRARADVDVDAAHQWSAAVREGAEWTRRPRGTYRHDPSLDLRRVVHDPVRGRGCGGGAAQLKGMEFGSIWEHDRPEGTGSW